MRWADLTPREAAQRLRGEGIRWRTGAMVAHLQSDAPGLAQALGQLYAHHPLLEPPWQELAGCHLRLERDRGLRRWWRTRVHFRLDGPSPFHPFPLDHALPLFEWGYNFCIASRAHQFMIFHGAVVERPLGGGLLLPGEPGSGKSTLAAALALAGWRLLSDEFGLLRPESGVFEPLARPVALKNESIAAIRAYSPGVVLGPEYSRTRKGVVSHLPPPSESVDRQQEGVFVEQVVVPWFEAGAQAELTELSPEQLMLRLGGNAYNYELQGERGFRAVTAMARRCKGYALKFGSLEDAVALLEGLKGS